MIKGFFILISTVTLVTFLLLGAFKVWFAEPPPQPAIVVNIETEIAQFESQLAAQEAVYQAELESLGQSLQAQQGRQETQEQALNRQIETVQDQFANLQQKKESLQSQITQLEAIQIEQQHVHESQLKQIHDQYDEQLNRLQAQLSEARVELAQFQAQP